MCTWFSLVALFFIQIFLIRRMNRIITDETCHEAILYGVDSKIYYDLPFEGWSPFRFKQILSMVIVPVFSFLGMLRSKTYDDSF